MDQTTASMRSLANSTRVTVAQPSTADSQKNFWMYLATISRWAETEVKGTQAENGILNWMKNGNVNAVLDISGLNLRTLPPLPDNLKKLKAGKNALTSIPENHLPVTLEEIDLACNQLTSLPESLPISQLKLLNAADNKLSKLPGIAYNINRECKVYFRTNNIDPALLTSLFGPEQHINGMRRASTAVEFTTSQAEALKTLMVAISAWMPTDDLSLELFAKDVFGTKLLANFLNNMQKAPYVKTADLKASTAKIIRKMSIDLKLCFRSFEIMAKSPNLSTHRLACLFFKLKHLSIHNDVENGLYNGRPADLVAFMRQAFRSGAIYRYLYGRLQPQHRDSQQNQDELWGDIATFISPFIDLELEVALVKPDKSNSALDIIELTEIIPNYIKDMENKQFPTYFAKYNTQFLYFLQIADPRMAEIMSKDTDSNGTTLQSEGLEQFRIKKINEYFAQIGQPDLLGQVWPTIDYPDNSSIPLLDFDFSLFSQIDSSQLSPVQREQVEKCLIQ